MSIEKIKKSGKKSGPGGHRPGAGRPLGSGSGPQGRARTLYVGDSEWQAWQAAAAAVGLSLSEWIRRACTARLRS